MKDLIKNESGQGMAEYALILSLVVIVIVGVLSIFGIKINDFLYKAVNNWP